MGSNSSSMELTLNPSPVRTTAGTGRTRLMLTIVPSGDRSDHDPSASAVGYVLHDGEAHELLATIHALTEGIALQPERIVRKVNVRIVPERGPMADLIGLSPRETDVLRGMVDGLSYKMVADRLGISFETVRTHVKKIYDKLGVHNCTEAVAKALKTGLLN